MKSSQVRLRTLGGLALTSPDGRELFLSGQRKRLALLAVLAADTTGGASRDRLLALFWAESDADRARNALAQMLYAIRADLGADSIEAGPGDLRLNNAVIDSDIRRFRDALASQDLASAVGVYEGPFLDGVYLRGVPEFERWADDTRQELATAFRGALESLTRKALEGRVIPEAVTWSRRLSAADPLNSRATLLLMCALERAGDPAGAVKAAELHASLLEHEIGVGLPEEIAREVHRLRQASPVSMRSHAVVIAPPAEPDRSPGAVARRVMNDSPNVRPSAPSRVRGIPFVIAAVPLIAVGGLAAFAIAERHREERPPVFAVAASRAMTEDSAITRLNALVTATLAQEIVQTHRAAVIDLHRSPAGSSGAVSSPSEEVALARRAGADRVLTSEIYRAGDSALVRMQILDTKDGRITEQLDPTAAPLGKGNESVGPVRDKAAGAVAALADTAYRAWSTAGARLPNYSAYSEFKLGLEVILHPARPKPAGPGLAIEHLMNAARMDTAFMQAKVWLLDEADRDPTLGRFADSVQAALLAQRGRAGPYDQASIDNVVASRSGDWENAYQAARRMVTIAPSLQDAHVALTRGAMATRRYGEAIRTLHMLPRMRGWLTDLDWLWQWDIQAHHITGDDEGALAHWRTLRTTRANDGLYCPWAIPSLVALNREAAVDALVAECVRTDPYPAPNIPDRMYFDNVLPEYVARGNMAAARRVVARIRPEFERFAPVQVAKAHDLAYMECMLGEWERCYARLRATVDTSRHNFLDIRRLGVAAAHVRDTTMVNAILRYFEANKANEHRGWSTMFRAMIVAAGGDPISASGLLSQSMNEGVAPCGCEWQSWPNYWGRGPEWFSNWYSMWELQPLRGISSFDLLVRERR